ncbi:MAG: hypothetical protein WC558_04730 [Patulibacter sp.]
MSNEAGITAPGARLQIRIERYEYPRIQQGPDANWLLGDVRLTAGTSSLFRANVPVTIMADELARLRNGLLDLLEGRTDHAVLHHMEVNVGATIRSWDGLLLFSCFVRDDFAPEIRLREVQITRDQLQEAFDEFDDLLQTFPVRAPA